MPRGRRGALAAASALAVVAGSACGAPVDITELRVAAATRAEPTMSAQAIPQRLPPAQVERADVALSDCPGHRCLSVVVTGDVLLHPPRCWVGLISATYGLNSGEPDEPWMVTPLVPEAIVAKAERAKAAGADIVIVAIHAGTEYQTEPDSDQVEAATALLASPAIDLVYGHHARGWGCRAPLLSG